MSIIIFQHSSVNGPGRIGATLRDHGFRLDVRRLDLAGQRAVPPDLDNVQGVISLGGPQNVGEDHDWMPAELEYLKEAHARQVPVIGICLGAQLVAHALGGKVGPMTGDSGPRSEWGFHRIGINPVGQVETMLSGIPWNAHHFCAHAHEVKELPPEAVLLASSDLCKVHFFRCGLRTYGFQHHPECDRPMIDALFASDPQSVALAAPRLNAEELARQAEQHYAEFARISDRLCVNIATYLFPLHQRLAG